jgi:hypothetical protein
VGISGEFAKSSTDSGRNVEGFYDNSLWERRKLDGSDAIKNLMREGVPSIGGIGESEDVKHLQGLADVFGKKDKRKPEASCCWTRLLSARVF